MRTFLIYFISLIIPITLFVLGNLVTFYAFFGPPISFYVVLGESVILGILTSIMLLKYIDWDKIKATKQEPKKDTDAKQQ